ncbi:TIR domain-containing protein [Pseudoblastomonas halimionae]|uniref:Nucleoside 2-deoxyribosyltransferase n=1 Tax=Alteriqipengyuania halimionae TaxID=1926630 RepID=A0A6I4U0W6_9SPHN|nr:hypothetical protein [Alteriqipengyuania halimionae]MXP08565.1 hypothetical protein [Alteriqipengyuania halimionae]
MSAPFQGYDATLFNCSVCGQFAISRTALVDNLDQLLPSLTKVRRAALSHKIRLDNDREGKPRMWLSNELRDFIEDGPALPTPGNQATNILRWIGTKVQKTGEPVEILTPDFHSSIGAPSRQFACDLLAELRDQRLVVGMFIPDVNGPSNAQELNLTLNGWELYDQEQKGLVSGSYGFIALKFGDTELDGLINDHVKPALAKIGYETIDLRDVSQAGVIDNIMRMHIRDCAFLIADLTHENAGAYWEAGFAEGLGKPVLYICEAEKFEKEKTHFDTNHCTTVPWRAGNETEFVQELIATIRRSLLL